MLNKMHRDGLYLCTGVNALCTLPCPGIPNLNASISCATTGRQYIWLKWAPSKGPYGCTVFGELMQVFGGSQVWRLPNKNKIVIATTCQQIPSSWPSQTTHFIGVPSKTGCWSPNWSHCKREVAFFFFFFLKVILKLLYFFLSLCCC